MVIFIKTRVIANPPFGVYSGDIHIGQAFYHVLLDVYARFLAKFSDVPVVFPAYSLNFFGRKADALVDKEMPDGELGTRASIGTV